MATSAIEIRFKCAKLKGRDLLSKSDPFLVFYTSVNGMWHEIGRTETVVNSHDPVFNKAFTVDYYFEEIQSLKAEVYDRDNDSKALSKHDFLGQVEFTLGRLMGSRGQLMSLNLQKKNNGNTDSLGQIEIRAEEVATCADVLQIQFSASKIDNTDGFFGKSDPFLNIYRSSEDGKWVRVWSSEVLKNTLNPTWRETKIRSQLLCNGDYQRPLKVECMDWERNGTHQFIGSLETSVQQWIEGTTRQFPLINPQRRAKKGPKYKNSGMLNIMKLQVYRVPTFVEFLRGGLEINLMVGIDYTASNGAPSTPSSLHFMQGQFMNQYQMAIHATGTILQEYDHDRMFPVYGFGGSINGQVNHCFPVTMDPTHAQVSGVNGILEAYQNSFQFVSLHGPTLFSPLIHTAGQTAAACAAESPNKYVILLILTDGVIMDMQQTVDAIVYASQFPLSIVIVGVGNADFTAMDALDADGTVLVASNGSRASRDIVQFVPFSRFQQNAARLAKETLAEIPRQVENYMSSRNIQPGLPLKANTPAGMVNPASAPPAPVFSSHVQKKI